jgi:hypothetical protein
MFLTGNSTPITRYLLGGLDHGSSQPAVRDHHPS